MRRATRRGRGISLLVPFTPGDPDRDRLWAWLRDYWQTQLPKAEIVMGFDPDYDPDSGVSFSKTAAVNAAAKQARGDVLVILDADAYISPELIVYCAEEIRRARRFKRRLWFVPYRRFYRVSEGITDEILASNPRNPWTLHDPLPKTEIDPTNRASAHYGHHFAAMIMVLPREAFEVTGGMDERFAGWGGEDISFMRAVDTIYNNHKTVDHAVYHLYHPTIGAGIHRQWSGQTEKMPFTVLGSRYNAAYGDRARMLRLNSEWRTVQSP